MRSITERVLASQAKAVEAAKGESFIAPDGALVTPPTAAQVLAMALEMIRLLSGRVVLPSIAATATRLKMSNQALLDRADQLDIDRAARGLLIEAQQQLIDQQRAELDTVNERITAAATGVLEAAGVLVGHVADQFTAALGAQGQAFTLALATARTELHAEILGTAGPLLDTIKQIQALDLSDEAQDAAVHNQLFALLGQQGQQLTQLVAAQTTLGDNQKSTQASVATLQGTVGGHSTDIAALKLADTGLRTDLTTTTNTANGLLTSVTNLTSTVNGHTTDLTKRLRNDQSDGTAYNLTAKKASAAGQVVTYEQLGDRQRTATVPISGQVLTVGTALTATVTWPTPFLDDKYVVAGPLASNATLLGSQWVLVSQTKEGCVLQLKNGTLANLNLTAGTLQVTATHN